MTDFDQDIAPSGLQTSDYILHYWRRRWWIIGLTLATFVVGYVSIRVFMSNSYRASALVAVREQPRLTDIDRDSTGVQPPSFKGMFLSDHALDSVRQRWNTIAQQFKGTPDEVYHPVIKQPFEKYKRRFSAKSVTTVDTTIQTEFSPVIELTALGNTPTQAYQLMLQWINVILSDYGNLVTEEARFASKASKARADELRTQVEEAHQRKENLKKELLLVETEIASTLRQLTNAPIPEIPEPMGTDIVGFIMDSGPRTTAVTMGEGTREGEPGLWEQRTRLEARLEAARRTKGEDSPEIQELTGQLEVLDAIIAGKREELRNLVQSAAGLNAEMNGVGVEISRLDYAVRLLSSAASQAEALIRPVEALEEGSENTRDPEYYGSLRLISPPVQPELRVWPKRTLLAGIAAAVTLVVLLVAFGFERYILRATEIDAARRHAPAK